VQNFLIITVFFQFVMCILLALLNRVWLVNHEEMTKVMKIEVPGKKQPALVVKELLVCFMRWVLITTGFIPVSLLCTFEFLKYTQGYYLEKEKIFKTKGKTLKVQTSTLNDQLGQINYIFSDKTGTLTKNKMIFRMLFANGKKYGNVSNIVPAKNLKHNNSLKNLQKRRVNEMPSPVVERLLEEDVDDLTSKISKRNPHPLVDFED
jgi:magnesium-transporting ATPase (P-type)